MVVCTVTRCQCRYLYPVWCGQEAPVRPPYYWLLLSATLVCVKFLQRRDQCGHLNTAGYMETCYTGPCCTGHHWRHHKEPAQVHVNTLPHQYFLRFSKYFFGDSPNIFNSNPSILTGVRNSLRWSRGVYHLCVCRLTDV